MYENFCWYLSSILRQPTWIFDFHEHELKSIIPQDHRIFCVDEAGITAVQHSKFVSTRGKQEVASLASAGRGNLNTLIACMNATSPYFPPLIVFPRKNVKEELMDGARAGSISAYHPRCWIRTDNIYERKRSLHRPTTDPQGSRRLRLPDFGTIGT